MLRKLSALCLTSMLLYPGASYGGPDGPSNYDECIIDAMKGVSSDVAARAIIESCRNLFPASPAEPPPAAPEPAAVPAPRSTPEPAPAAEQAPTPDLSGARALSADELGRLRSKAKVFGSKYRVTIENGNTDLALTEVTIAVWDESDPAAGRKQYSEPVQIGPLASAEVKYTVHYRGDESGWAWSVAGARGVAVPARD